jgi:hypothetical protein
MQDRGYGFPRIPLLETVWKLGWRGVNEARSASLRRENTLSLPLYVGL